LLYQTFHLGMANRQKSRWNVRIYPVEKKVTFQKGAWY